MRWAGGRIGREAARGKNAAATTSNLSPCKLLSSGADLGKAFVVARAEVWYYTAEYTADSMQVSYMSESGSWENVAGLERKRDTSTKQHMCVRVCGSVRRLVGVWFRIARHPPGTPHPCPTTAVHG